MKKIIVIDTTGSEPLIEGKPLTPEQLEMYSYALGTINHEAEIEKAAFLEAMKRKDRVVIPIKDVKTGLTVGAPQAPQLAPKATIQGVMDPDALDQTKTILRLQDGSYVNARRGRRPEGSTVHKEAPQTLPGTTTDASGLTSKVKPVMIRLADGTTVPRGRGRPPKGSVVIK